MTVTTSDLTLRRQVGRLPELDTEGVMWNAMQSLPEEVNALAIHDELKVYRPHTPPNRFNASAFLQYLAVYHNRVKRGEEST